MARPQRIWQHEYPYSITTRVNNREFHLRSAEVTRIFFAIFEMLQRQMQRDERTGKAKRRYLFSVHHFLVMDNHYHLVISVSGDTRIDQIMQLINSLAARAINRFLGRTGHLWGDRYKMRVLNCLSYLSRSIRYVYQNPRRAGMVKRVANYARSTLRFYISMFRKKPTPSWLIPDPWTEDLLDERITTKSYLELMENPIAWAEVESAA